MKKLLLMTALVVAVFAAGAQSIIFSEDFETGTPPAGWTLIDADGNGQNWVLWDEGYGNDYDGYSFASYPMGSSTNDNWMVTPAISLGTASSLSFFRKTGFFTQAHYGVYVSTTSATDITSFTLLQEETPSYYAWSQITVDLNAYSDQTVYIAFRHFDNSNAPIQIDNIEVTSTMSASVITTTPGSLLFTDVPVNTSSAAQTVTVNRINVTGDITATVGAPFEISSDGSGYTLSVSLSSTDENLYVRYSPVLVGSDSSVLILTGSGATASVILAGNAIACAAPTGLTTAAVTSTSATLLWTGSTDDYDLYYKAASDTEWTVIEDISADTAGYTIANLTPSTTYSWYVAAVCSDGSTNNSATTGTFTTGCGSFTAPFAQSFDATGIPQCWERYNGLVSNVFAGGALTSTTSGWVFSNTNVFGAYHARLNIYGTSCNRWLVTPSIDLSALTNPVLTFELALTTWNTSAAITDPNGQPDDKFMVIVSTDDGATWSAANATVWSNDGNGDYSYNQIPNTGEEISISLADYANQTVRIAFYGESTLTNGDNDLHIDNVMVNNATSCTKPTDLTVTAVTDNTVTLDWTENGTATAWNIEYGPTGYQQGSSAGTMLQATATPFTVNYLDSISYDFYVQSDCGGDQSLWVGPVTARPGQYNIGVSGSATLTTCAMTIYDNGGPNGNYAPNCNSELVLMPETVGSSISVFGSYHTENCCDYLRIYDGIGINGTMLGEYKGTGTIPTLVSSTGPLTLLFHSDSGVQYDGFEVNVTCASCAPPGNLTVANVGPDSANVTWSGVSSTYKVEYKSAEDTTWTTVLTPDTALALHNLTPSTVYTVRVSSDCGDEFSPATTLTFSTTMVPTGIPFSTDFSDATGWILNNGSCQNYWTIAPTGNNGNALFVTNNGTTPGYAANSFSGVSAEKLFTVGAVSELAVSFDVQIGGETQFDYLKVYLAPADEQYPAVTTDVNYTNFDYSTYAVNFTDYLQYSSYTSGPYKFNLTGGNTVHVSVVMPNPNDSLTPTSTAKLVFLWKNDTSDGSQPGAIISSVSVEALSCPAPMALTVSNVTTTTADVTWSAGGTEDDWMLEYKEEGAPTWTSVPVSGTPAYSFTNLTVGASYQVRVQALCSATDQSVWVNTQFTTFCDAITAFPFSEGFEHDGAMPDCWAQDHVSGILNWTTHAGCDSHGNIGVAHSGSYNAFFFEESTDGHATRLVTPVLDLSSITDPYLTYWFAQQPWGTDQDQLSVFYRTSPNDNWQLLTQHYSAVSTWTKDSLDLPNPSATYQLAFLGVAHYGYGIVLDDIFIDGTPAGPVLTDPTVATLAATGIGQTTATLHATITNPDNVTITERGFELTTVSTGNVATFTVAGSGNTYSSDLTNLTAETDYSFRAFITFNGNTVYGNEMTFTTEAEPSDTVGIADRLAGSVTLYPNPAREMVNVHWRMENGQLCGELYLFDVYGKLLQIVPVTSEITPINVSGLADGLYFVRMTTKEGMVTKTFVKKG